MSSQLVRLASFATWPSTAAVSSLALARSGFKYTGHGESTLCTECQLVVDSWQQGDRPDQVHRQRSPNCTFVHEHLQANGSSTTMPAAVSATVEHSSVNNDVKHRAIGSTTTDNVAYQHRAPGSTTTDLAYQLPVLSIDRDSPDFSHLKNEEVRLSTFRDWPERAAAIVEPREIAKAGMFYTGQADRVQCAYCRGYLRNWVQGDRPADEHRRHFPDCSFVKTTSIGAYDVVDYRHSPNQV